MDPLFRRSVGVSILFHLVIFVFGSIAAIPERKYVVTIPVDLIHFIPPPRTEEAKEVVRKEEVVTVAPRVRRRKRPTPRKEEPSPSAPVPPQPAPRQPASVLTPDTAKFPYLFYLRKIRDRVSSNWAWRDTEPGDLKSTVHFRIKRDGSISQVELRRRSGDVVFDNLALRAIKVSSPFPPLPAGYENETLGIYFEFAYRE